MRLLRVTAGKTGGPSNNLYKPDSGGAARTCLQKNATRIPLPPEWQIAPVAFPISRLNFGAECDYLPIYSLHLARYTECILTLSAKVEAVSPFCISRHTIRI